VLDAEVEQAYARARVLCERLGNGPKLLVPLWGLWAYELMRGEIEHAQGVAQQLRALAAAGGASQPLPALVAAATSGMTLFYRGELQAARTALAEGLELARLPPAPTRGARGVHDPGVMCHAFHALACWLLGEPERAAAAAATLRDSIPALPPFDAAYAWCADALLHTLSGDAAAACESAARGIAIGEEQAFPAWQTMGAMLQGWGRARQGEAESALAQMQRSYEAWCASGARNLRPLFLALLADAWLARGDPAQALRCADEGLAEAATGEHCWDPELHRLRAEALARRGQPGPAKESARRAVAAAHDMEARGWMQRANSNLERLLQGQATTG
jgi:predicted ATPase